MPSTIQCQKPEPVGASGSKQVTAKLLVCSGKPDQDSDGETLPPVMPHPSKTWLSLNISLCAMSSLRSSNDGTGGMKSYGSGGRSVMRTSSVRCGQGLRTSYQPAAGGAGPGTVLRHDHGEAGRPAGRRDPAGA